MAKGGCLRLCRFQAHPESFFTYFPLFIWNLVSMQNVNSSENALTDCSLSLVGTDGQTKKNGYEVPDELECKLLHSFAKFCYVPGVHCISLLAWLCQWRRSKTGCPRKKKNKRLFICEQLLFPSVVSHFKKFEPVPWPYVSQFTVPKLHRGHKTGAVGVGDIFLKGTCKSPEGTGEFRIDRASTLTVQGLRVERKDHKTDAQ